MTIPSITSLGIGAGIDANNIVASLLAVERAPLNALNQRESAFQARISAFGSLSSKFDALKTASENISTPSSIAAYTATVADEDVLSATAGSFAGAGSYSVNVTQLAEAQKSFSASLYGDADTFAAGTLTFTIGTQNVDVAFGGGSLADVRNAINEANIGVSATTVTGDAGTRLVLTSKETGTDSAFSLAVAGGDANLQSLANFDAAHASKRDAANAIVQVEGETITSQSNKITGAIPDVTLNATALGATNVDVARSTDKLVDNVKAFVTAFNEASNELRSSSSFDAESKTAGPLNGDATVRTLQGLLRETASDVPAEVAGTAFETLSSLGIEFQRDGTLKLDETKLNSAVDTDFDATVNTLNAFGQAMANVGDQATRFDGLLTSRTSGLNDSIRNLESQRERMEFQLELTEKRLRAQFTSLDKLMGQLNATSAYLGQQLAGLAASS